MKADHRIIVEVAVHLRSLADRLEREEDELIMVSDKVERLRHEGALTICRLLTIQVEEHGERDTPMKLPD